MPSMEIGRRFFCQVIVGRGLPIAGHRSLTVLPLSVIMVVVSGLIIVGGAEGIKMKYNEHIPTEKNKLPRVGHIICNFNKTLQGDLRHGLYFLKNWV